MSGGWNYGSKNGYNVVGEGDCQEGGHGWNELGQGKPGRFSEAPYGPQVLDVESKFTEEVRRTDVTVVYKTLRTEDGTGTVPRLGIQG